MAHFIQSSWESPVGRLRIVISDQVDDPPHCVGLYFSDHHPSPKYWSDETPELDWRQHDLTNRVVEQLAGYFTDGRFRFDLPCRFHGTDFQQQVWHQLTLIPAGATRSYREIANSIGRPAAVRAVGSAVGRNPMSILVPCHRVIASGGGLAGFAGGLARKKFLLSHEAAGDQDNRANQSTTVTTPVPTIAQPSTVRVRDRGHRPVHVTRAATMTTATTTNAKEQPPTLA